MDSITAALGIELEPVAFDAVYKDNSKVNETMQARLSKPKLYMQTESSSKVPIPLSVVSLTNQLIMSARTFLPDTKALAEGLGDLFLEFSDSPECEFLGHWATFHRSILQGIAESKNDQEVLAFFIADMLSFYEQAQPAVEHDLKGIHTELAFPDTPSAFRGAAPVYTSHADESEMLKQMGVDPHTGTALNSMAGSSNESPGKPSGVMAASPHLQRVQRKGSVVRLSVIQSQKAMEDLRAQLAAANANASQSVTSSGTAKPVVDDSAKVATESEADIYKSIMAQESPSSSSKPSKPRRAAPKPKRSAPPPPPEEGGAGGEAGSSGGGSGEGSEDNEAEGGDNSEGAAGGEADGSVSEEASVDEGGDGEGGGDEDGVGEAVDGKGDGEEE